MRDPGRIPWIMSKLAQLWMKYPDQRLGQLVCNLARDEFGQTNMNRVWAMEDDILEDNIESAIEEVW